MPRSSIPDQDGSRPVPPLTAFGRSQVAAFGATAFDFCTLVLLVELAGFWYLHATVVGALAGAILNFLLNRHWSFEAGSASWHAQALRYATTSGLSLLLNTGGVYALTELLGLQYAVSKVIASIFVGLAFNYPMHRFFVFRRTSG